MQPPRNSYEKAMMQALCNYVQVLCKCCTSAMQELNATLCNAMQFYTMLCSTLQHYVHYAMLCNAMKCYATLCIAKVPTGLKERQQKNKSLEAR